MLNYFYPTVRSDWTGMVRTSIGPAPDVAYREWFELHFLANGKEAFLSHRLGRPIRQRRLGIETRHSRNLQSSQKNAAGWNCRLAEKRCTQWLSHATVEDELPVIQRAGRKFPHGLCLPN
jgi:hypothetical protein